MRMRPALLPVLLLARGATCSMIGVLAPSRAVSLPVLPPCRAATLICMQPDFEQYEAMLRSDRKSPDELAALQTIGGGAGLILGPPLLGSSAIGLLVGIAIARYVALEPGHIGAVARELGWALSVAALSWRECVEQMLLSRAPPLSAPRRAVWRANARTAVSATTAQITEELRHLNSTLGLHSHAEGVRNSLLALPPISMICGWVEGIRSTRFATALVTKLRSVLGWVWDALGMSEQLDDFWGKVERREQTERREGVVLRKLRNG